MNSALIALLALGLLGGLAVAGIGDDDDGTSSGLNPDETEGSDGDDELFSAIGSDELNGYGGDDDIMSIDGADTLSGGDGNDVLIALDTREETDTDYLYGGNGNDALWGDNEDVVTGGAGTDGFVAGAFPESEFDFSQQLALDRLDISFLTADEISPSRITDFDPETEVLELVAGDNINLPIGVVAFEAIEGENAVRAGVVTEPGVGGEEDQVAWLAILDNVTVADMEAAQADGRVSGFA